MLEFLLSCQPTYGHADKEGLFASTAIDLFFDYATKAAKLKLHIMTQGPGAKKEDREAAQMLKDQLSGISYILMMHFGNDVLYFKRADQLKVYRRVKDKVEARLLEGGIRLAPYARLIIEPLFAYNHFEDEDEEGSFGSYGSDDEDDGAEDDDDVKKKKTKKQKKSGKPLLQVTDIKFDIPLGGNIDEVTEKLKQHFTTQFTTVAKQM